MRYTIHQVKIAFAKFCRGTMASKYQHPVRVNGLPEIVLERVGIPLVFSCAPSAAVEVIGKAVSSRLLDSPYRPAATPFTFS
jgi:hypothetical protein